MSSTDLRLVSVRDVVELVLDVVQSLVEVALLLRLPQRALAQLVDVVGARRPRPREQQRLWQTHASSCVNL